MTDRDLRSICRGFRNGLLNSDPSKGMCFIVSTALQGYLSVCGIETKLIEGEVKNGKEVWNHYWLELPDGRIIDSTMDQFDDRHKIFIGIKPKRYKVPRFNLESKIQILKCYE